MDCLLNSGIYCIRHIPTGRVYVGQAAFLKRRWIEHKSELRCNKHKSQSMQEAWNSDGIDAFEFVILERVDRDGKLLKEAEQRWLDAYRPYGSAGFNTYKRAADSGLGAGIGLVMRPEVISARVATIKRTLALRRQA